MDDKQGMKIDGRPPEAVLIKHALNAFKMLPAADKRRAVNRGYVDISVGEITLNVKRSPQQEHRAKVKGSAPRTINILKRVWLPGQYYRGAPRGVHTACIGGLEYQFTL